MKKRLYFDMDGVLVDFESGLAQQSEATLKEYEGRFDEIPGLFGLMKPMLTTISSLLGRISRLEPPSSRPYSLNR